MLVYLYCLVPLLTVSIEDAYFLNKLSTGLNNPAYWLFSKSLPLPPIVIFMLVSIGFVLMFRPTRINPVILSITLIFLVALATGIIVGLFGKVETPKLFFEFQYWRSLVFFIVITLIMTKLMTVPEFEKFLAWFVLVQFLYAVYALVGLYIFGQGQSSNVGKVVPIFAGDQIAFVILACFILSAQNVVKPRFFPIIAEAVLILVLVLSLRRTAMAAAAASLVLAAALLLIRNGKGKRILALFTLGVTGLLILGTIIWVTQRSKIESSFVFQRFQSINPFWGDRQSNVLLSSMGHTDDFLDGLDLVLQSPILGQGLNTDLVLLRTSSWQEDNLHSTMFSLWVKMGLPGLVFYLFVSTYGIRYFFNGLKSRDLSAPWLVLFTTGFSIFNFLTTVYANGVFLGYKNATCLAIYMAGCLILSKELSPNGRKNPSLVQG
jgi:O-antigen ligase